MPQVDFQDRKAVNDGSLCEVDMNVTFSVAHVLVKIVSVALPLR